MRKIFALLALCLAGCYQNNSAQPFHDDGRAKPRVALLSLYDHSDAQMPWSLSQEFTDEISSKLNYQGHLYLKQNDDLPIPLPVIEGDLNPFQDHTWLINENTDVEFYVFLELVDHSMQPREAPETNPSYDLMMSVRIKVVDVRAPTPRIILQEFVEQTSLVPKQLVNLDYHRYGYGKATFGLSPVGIAHGKLIKKVANRIQDYILLAKTHS
ncbi:MAG: hypothetical protein MRY21_03520 [Simkaniaceae bacterium]|nr:hypothetical protein [Simkaniaceae bacterium]